MTLAIERLKLEEMGAFMRIQANDTFPDLKDERRLNMLAKKWITFAESCTCRDDEGCLVGIIVFYANRPNEAVAFIPHVYVSREYRGRRIFSSMLHLVQDYVSEKGFRLIRLEVKKSNETAEKVYSQYGFTPMKDSSEDAVYMQFEIPHFG